MYGMMDGMNGMMNGMMDGDWTSWGGSEGLGGWFGGAQMFLMGIVPLLLIGLVVWLVLEANKRNDGSRRTSPSLAAPHSGPTIGSERTPQSILDERYARGEIDREEYVQRRADLGR